VTKLVINYCWFNIWH